MKNKSKIIDKPQKRETSSGATLNDSLIFKYAVVCLQEQKHQF